MFLYPMTGIQQVMILLLRLLSKCQLCLKKPRIMIEILQDEIVVHAFKKSAVV